MDLYLKKYTHVEREDFGHFTLNAHVNASSSRHATLPKLISNDDYKASVMHARSHHDQKISVYAYASLVLDSLQFHAAHPN